MATGADLEFDATLLEYFQCDRGAYSPVTWTEAKDGQVTLTGFEKQIALDFFGADDLAKYRGSQKTLAVAGLDASRKFRLFPSGKFIYPQLNYAKSKGGELRLYFNNEEFKVEVGHLWGIFVKENDIWLCDFTPWWKNDITEGKKINEAAAIPLEPEVDGYQDALNGTPPEQVVQKSMRWKRDPKIAATVLQQSRYICEWRPDLETFSSKSTGKPFLEAHHFIPMKAQSAFPDHNLDTGENICILNPLAHRMLHYAPFELVRPGLEKMMQARKPLLDRLQIGQDYIFEIYNKG